MTVASKSLEIFIAPELPFGQSTIGASCGEVDQDEGAAPAGAGDAPNPGEAASASRNACSFVWSREVLSKVPPVPFIASSTSQRALTSVR
jgi:hypothetical protein